MQFQQNKKITYIQQIDADYPVIFIDTKALMKMHSYVQKSDKEISWLGTVERNTEKNTFRITDVMLVPQATTTGTADLDEAGLSALGSRLLKEGKLDVYNSIRMWGHSHVKAPIDPSGTDNETFKQFYETCDYFIRLITNKNEEMKIDLVDCEKQLQYMNLDWYEVKSEQQIKLEKLFAKFMKQQEHIQEAIDVEIEKEMKQTIDKATFHHKKNNVVKISNADNWTVPWVIISTNSGGQTYTNILNVFTEDDIKYLMENCENYLQLCENLYKYDEFVNYTEEDYARLYGKLEDYYWNSGLIQK